MWFLEHAWLIPLIPAASFLLILFFGKRMPYKGAEIGIAALAICFALAVGRRRPVASPTSTTPSTASRAPSTRRRGRARRGAARAARPSRGAEPATPRPRPRQSARVRGRADPRDWTWWQSGDVEFTAGMLVDGLGVMMLFVVTLISLLVHIYSTDYVGGDRRYTHYFAFLSLFTASMLVLVMSENTLQLLTCWELVGLCSFALIGHWWEEKPNSDAALKAFITNRVGDVGLHLRRDHPVLRRRPDASTSSTINEMAVERRHQPPACCWWRRARLLAAVMSKSGQFVLHTWLPDAMAGPTPVSALIHAATMVVAGIFMVARLYAVFFEGLSIGALELNLLAVVGGVTVIGRRRARLRPERHQEGARLLDGVSQLGYMVMALGVGAWTAALFHLFTHAIFKAGLFLGVGLGEPTPCHSFDMKERHGRHAEVHAEDVLDLHDLHRWRSSASSRWRASGRRTRSSPAPAARRRPAATRAFMVVGIIGAFMTAAYMTRCVYLTFYGEPRARGRHGAPAPRVGPPHPGAAVHPERPGHRGRLRQPPDAFDLAARRLDAAVRALLEPKGAVLPGRRRCLRPPRVQHRDRAGRRACSALIGIGLAYVWYFRGPRPPRPHRAATSWPGPATRPRQQVLPRLALHRRHRRRRQGPDRPGVYWFNQKIIDGVVNGAGASACASGQFVYEQDRPGRRSTGSSTAPARPPSGSGQGSAPDPDRSGPAVRRAALRRRRHPGRHLHHRHLARHRGPNGTMDNNDFLTDWGLSLMVFLPLAGALVMMLHPEGRGAAHQGRRARRLAGLGRRRHRRPGRLRLRRRRQPAVRASTSSWIEVINSSLHGRHRRPLAAAASRSPC